ncbi:MAG: peptide-methionine (S)-S-oxide reductase MsrA [Gallionellaceae bacterium]
MSEKQIATFAGGCFWCLEAVFELMPGVENVVSGYIGGATANPNYDAISTGKTGHAEAVLITFDPNQVSYKQLLKVFFTIHDPTTLNRQGSDVGTQYRSAIFYHSEEQRREAEAMIAEINALQTGGLKLVTEVVVAHTFYCAEEEHQHYYARNREQGYCMMVVAPKVKKFKKVFLAPATT